MKLFLTPWLATLAVALRDDQNPDPLTAQVCVALEPNLPLTLLGITDVNDLYDLCANRFCLWPDGMKNLAALEINLLIQTLGVIETQGIGNNGQDSISGGTLLYGGFSLTDAQNIADEPCTGGFL